MPTGLSTYYKKDSFNAEGWTTYTITNNVTLAEAKAQLRKYRKDFIPLIKCMPNICKWLGLGRMVRRNKRRV